MRPTKNCTHVFDHLKPFPLCRGSAQGLWVFQVEVWPLRRCNNMEWAPEWPPAPPGLSFVGQSYPKSLPSAQDVVRFATGRRICKLFTLQDAPNLDHPQWFSGEVTDVLLESGFAYIQVT